MKVIKYKELPKSVKKISFTLNGNKIIIKNKKRDHVLAKFKSLINNN